MAQCNRTRARAEDRIRGLKDSGLQNLPLHQFAKNVIWLELVQLAAELLTWTQTLAFTGSAARTWEPNGSGCGCCTWPAGSSPPADATGCDCPVGGHGRTSSSAAMPACTPSPDSPSPTPTRPTENRRPQRRSPSAPPNRRHYNDTNQDPPNKVTKDRG
jgi:hypothetical protein